MQQLLYSELVLKLRKFWVWVNWK